MWALSINIYNYPKVKETFKIKGNFFSLTGIVNTLEAICIGKIKQEVENENSQTIN